MIKLYMTDVFECADILPSFSSYRKIKLLKSKNTSYIFQMSTAERLLCYAAKTEGLSLPLDIKVKDGGKPFADNLSFSISHSGKKVLVAIADCDIGVDIQKINHEQNINVARKFLTVDEMKNLDINSFFKFFTMKESYFKMTGMGLPLSPVPFKSFKKCFFESFRENEYFISICSENTAEFTLQNVPHSALSDF